MRLRILLGLLSIVAVAACRKMEPVPAHEDTFALSDRFHGRYQAIISTTSEAIDVNRDGKGSTDLLIELPELKKTHLELRIYGTDNLYFKQLWPDQVFTLGGSKIEPAEYDHTIEVAYEIGGVDWLFVFNQAITQLIILQDNKYQQLLNPEKLPAPQSVIITMYGQLQVTTSKKLYTRLGWKTVNVVTLYQRYTKQA